MPDFIFNAGHLALDLVNTEQISAGAPVDLLDRPATLLKWLRQSGAVANADMKRAEGLLTREPLAGERLLGDTRELRTAIRKMAEAIVDHRGISPRTLETINSFLRNSPRVPQLVPRQSQEYALEWHHQGSPEQALLATLAEAAGHLLAQSDHTRVRKCANPACILYFYDTTRSRTRHWCSMQSCGNRAKASRFYGRHHGRES